MNVELLTCTPNALDVLLFTKNTRLEMDGVGLHTVSEWTTDRKLEQLKYMRNTIQSSWEFVDYVFVITGVTRAFTHQLVRHRVGTSFAQQAQRVVDMRGFKYLATGRVSPDPNELPRWAPSGFLNDWTDDVMRPSDLDTPEEIYEWTMDAINTGYEALKTLGVDPQDARGVLPTNILTNIVFKANLRTLHDMALKRLCVKAQGEFQDVFRLLVDRVVAEHQWADDFLRVQCAWNGTCLFPSLPVEQCHVKPYVYDPERAMSYGQSSGLLSPHEANLYTTQEIYQLHRSTRTEIQPVGDPAPVLRHAFLSRHGTSPLETVPAYEEELVLAFMRDARENGAELKEVEKSLTQSSSRAALSEALRRLSSEQHPSFLPAQGDHP